MVEADIKRMLKDAEELGEKGQIEEAERLTDEVEKLRKTKDDLLLIAVNPTLASKQMKICEVCGAMQSINELEKRNLTHLEGKLHIGFDTLRKQLEILKKRLESVNLSIEVKKEEMLNEGRDPNREIGMVEMQRQRKGKVPDRNINFEDNGSDDDDTNKPRVYNERSKYNNNDSVGYNRDNRFDNRQNSFRGNLRNNYRGNRYNGPIDHNNDDRNKYSNRDRYDNRERGFDRDKRYNDNDNNKYRRDGDRGARTYDNERRDREYGRYDDRDRHRNDHRKDRVDRYDNDRRNKYTEMRSDRDDEYADRHKRIAKKDKHRKDSSASD